MPPDDRTTKAGERCELHPQSPSVARCEACGRTLCVACAVPVRGVVLGAECVSEAVGDDAPAVGPPAPSRRPAAWVMLAALGFGGAVAATLLPWTRFQEGSGPFGGWGLSPRWSLLVAVASVAGLVASVLGLARGPAKPRVLLLRILAILVVAGSALATTRPPAFAPPWLGPWVALASGILALGATWGRGRAPARTTGESQRS